MNNNHCNPVTSIPRVLDGLPCGLCLLCCGDFCLCKSGALQEGLAGFLFLLDSQHTHHLTAFHKHKQTGPHAQGGCAVQAVNRQCELLYGGCSSSPETMCFDAPKNFLIFLFLKVAFQGHSSTPLQSPGNPHFTILC